MGAPSFLDELMAPYAAPGRMAHAGPTPAKAANPANLKHPCGLLPDSGVCEGLRISAKAAGDSQKFADIRRPQNDPQSEQRCGVSQDSQLSQGRPPTDASDADTARFIERRDRLLRWGWPADEAEALAERLTRHDRERGDSMVSCTDCRHYRPSRCSNHRRAGLQSADVGRDLASLLQRCPGFDPRATREARSQSEEAT